MTRLFLFILLSVLTAAPSFAQLGSSPGVTFAPINSVELPQPSVHQEGQACQQRPRSSPTSRAPKAQKSF